MLRPGQNQGAIAPSVAGECSRCCWVCSDVSNRQNLPHLSMVEVSELQGKLQTMKSSMEARTDGCLHDKESVAPLGVRTVL